MPTLASTSRAQLAYILESVFGTTPVSGNSTKLRMTGEGLEHKIDTDESKEIRADRVKAGLIQTGASALGGVNFEFSYKEYDALLEALLQGTWTVYGTAGVGAVFTGTFVTATITAAVAPKGTSAFTGLAQGQWFQLIAPTNANDGKWFKVHASTPPSTTVITVDAATPLAAGTSIANSRVRTSRLSNGTTQRSFSLEKSFTDVTQLFMYRGMNVAKASLDFQSGKIVDGSFDFMGKDGVRATSTGMPGTAVESQTYDVMNAVSGVGQILEGGVALTSTYVKSLKFTYDNKLRNQDAIASMGPVGIGAGTIECMGSLEVYLADGSLYDKFLNNTASNLSVRSVDAAGNGYVVTLPNIKYKDAKVVAGSMDQDAMLSLPFEAFFDTGTGGVIFIDRVGA